MKFFILMLLTLLSLYAKESAQKITLGAGLYTQTQPYKNVDSLLLPSPVIFYDYDIFYIRWTRFGAYFMGSKNDDYSWGFSLTAQPRTYGYTSTDIAGMNERKDSWEGGLALSAKIDDSYIEIIASTDMLNSEKRWILTSEFGTAFTISKFSFYPSFILTYQSKEFTNYYYGINANEALSSGFGEYKTEDGFMLSAQTYIEYPLTKKLSTLINLRADRLSKESINSPLTNQKYIYSGLASLIYTFEY